jgi:hypothetical protein
MALENRTLNGVRKSGVGVSLRRPLSSARILSLTPIF